MSGVQPTFRQVRFEPVDPEREGEQAEIKRGPKDPLKSAATPLYLHMRRLAEFVRSDGADGSIIEGYSGGSEGGALLVILLLVGIIVWVVAGVWALVMSLICFGRSGSGVEKVVGIVLAWLIGPFYWLYFAYNTSYCNK